MVLEHCAAEISTKSRESLVNGLRHTSIPYCGEVHREEHIPVITCGGPGEYLVSVDPAPRLMRLPLVFNREEDSICNLVGSRIRRMYCNYK